MEFTKASTWSSDRPGVAFGQAIAALEGGAPGFLWNVIDARDIGQARFSTMAGMFETTSMPVSSPQALPYFSASTLPLA